MEEQKINLLNPENFPPLSPPRPKKKRVFILIIIILGFLIIRYGIGRFITAKWPGTATAYDPITLQPKKRNFFQTVKNFIFNSDNNVVNGQQEDRINMLLLGIGGPGHDGPFLSDTNIILSIKPSTNQIAMISVPRDMMAKIDGHGYRKINYADAFGEAEQAGSGGEYARKIFAETLNLNIPYYVRADFKAFTELVDAVGGITVDAPKSFIDTQYPGPNESYQTISFTAGIQNMDGGQALKFARSRHGNNGEGSDFARARRQQIVLASLKEKILSAGTYLNPLRIQKILDSLSAHISTNLDFGQMMYLTSLAKEINGAVKTLVLDDSPNGFLKPITSEDGAFLLVPKTGNLTEINNAIQNIFAATSTPTINIIKQKNNALPAAQIEIQNGTWRLGLAAKTKQKLEEKGFLISSISNSTQRPLTHTAIYIINPNAPAEIVKNLTSEFQIQPSASLPDWLQKDYDDPNTTASESGMLKYKADMEILIILGEDTGE